MRWDPRLLALALLLLLGGAAVAALALAYERPGLSLAALVCMAVAALLFLVSLWRPRRRVDWERIRAEQRLWESGPLGRRWLRIRQRISETWRA